MFLIILIFFYKCGPQISVEWLVSLNQLLRVYLSDRMDFAQPTEVVLVQNILFIQNIVVV
jgi:hypothetical protein